jgi:DNA-binding NtrC family response regulator
MIAVYSRLGWGITFNIYLSASTKALQADVSMTRYLKQRTGSILLIDDEKIILEVGKSTLERMGYSVLVADRGEEAIDIIKEHGDAIDLVILDLIMPDMDGTVTFKRVRELYPQMTILMSSGYAINDKIQTLIQKGCNGFIQKPYSISMLSQKVRQILNKKNEERKSDKT